MHRSPATGRKSSFVFEPFSFRKDTIDCTRHGNGLGQGAEDGSRHTSAAQSALSGRLSKKTGTAKIVEDIKKMIADFDASRPPSQFERLSGLLDEHPEYRQKFELHDYIVRRGAKKGIMPQDDSQPAYVTPQF